MGRGKKGKKQEGTDPFLGEDTGAAVGVPLKVCGPTFIETLRGRLLGREVALICVGEAHEEAIDLTRTGCVTEPQEGWTAMGCEDSASFDPADAIASQDGLTLPGAKKWAERILAKWAEDDDSEEDDSEEEDSFEGRVVWVPAGKPGPKAKGLATAFPPDSERSAEFPLPSGAQVWEWGDLDLEAREFNRRRLGGERISTADHDALIDKRKEARLADGVEFLDDWVLRQTGPGMPHVRVLLESPVHPNEVEAHFDESVGPAPLAHECLRQLELDSDADSEDDDDPDDGTGCFADYFFRRVSAGLPEGHVRGVDPRDLGDATDDGMREAFRALLAGVPQAPDLEEAVLEAAGLEDGRGVGTPEVRFCCHRRGAPQADPVKGSWKEDRSERLAPVPSWEAFFGASAELLYYSPQVKADYAPFLSRCVGSTKALWAFYDALYFKTVPEALGSLRLCDETRPLAQLRSLAYRPSQDGVALAAGQLLLQRRPAVQSKIPVRAAPEGLYLKARGSQPPRTWLSGLAERLRGAGCADIVSAAQQWFRDSVAYLLSDPKESDVEGDYFAAWLRACHRGIWDDIDRSDPEELRKSKWVPSEEHPKSKKHRHDLKSITIPGLEDAFKEIAAFNPSERVSTSRERVLAKIIVDAFQLRQVDVAMVLAVADAVVACPPGEPVVVVLYAGEDHTRSAAEFWRGRGLSCKSLPSNGIIGKRDWEDDEPRAMQFRPYVQDFRNLFPVPK